MENKQLQCRLGLSILCFWLFFGGPAVVFAQTARQHHLWSFEFTGFANRYDSDIEFEPGWGGGVALGRVAKTDWLMASAGFEYNLATQNLRLVDGHRQARVGMFRLRAGLLGLWSPLVQRAFAALWRFGASAVLLDPQPFTLDTGTGGVQRLQPRRQVKFSPYAGAGLTYRVSSRLAIFLLVQQNFLRVESRQIDFGEKSDVWRSFWQYSLGTFFYL